MSARFIPNDRFARKAKEEDFRARSVYKLREIDERFGLLRPGMKVLDIGAAPGSWLQYVAERIGPKGKAVGIDLQAIDPIADNVTTAVCDIEDGEAVRRVLADAGMRGVDLILSDMAPRTSGIKDVDQWRSIELQEHALALSGEVLRKGGNCVMKVLRGADYDAFFHEVKRHFKTVKTVIVKATREGSKEVFVVALSRK